MIASCAKPFCFACEEPPVINEDYDKDELYLHEMNIQCPSDNIWLDHLPLEVNVRIAQHFIKISSTAPETHHALSLRLAVISPTQRLAVNHAFKFHFQLQGNDDLIIRLARLMRDDVRSVECIQWKGSADVVMPLLGSPSLRRASVLYNVSYLEALAAGNVHSLRVSFERTFPRAFEFTRMESVRELSIKWKSAFLTKTKELLQGLVASYPNVQKLELDCTKILYGEVHDGVRDLPVLSGFRELKLLRTNLPLVERDIRFLRKLGHVELITCSEGLYGGNLGLLLDDHLLTANVLTAIDIRRPLEKNVPHEQMCTTDLGMFKDCKRLVRLQLFVRDKIGLEGLHLPALESLCLKWYVTRSSIHEVQSDFLRKIVQTFPAIRELELYCVRISLQNVTWLLEALGGKLDVFGLSLSRPSKEDVSFASKVMQAVVACSPSLQYLRLFSISSFPPACEYWRDDNDEVHVRMSDDSTPPSESVLSAWKSDILWMVAVLERCTEVRNGQELRGIFAEWCSLKTFTTLSSDSGSSS